MARPKAPEISAAAFGPGFAAGFQAGYAEGFMAAGGRLVEPEPPTCECSHPEHCEIEHCPRRVD